MVESMAYEPQPRGDADTALADMEIVCAWCRQHMVWHRVQTPIPFPVSYSICDRCYTGVAQELMRRTPRDV